MYSSRAFRVRYLGPTNKKGSRIRIIDCCGILKPLTVSWDYAVRGTVYAQAYRALRDRGWNVSEARSFAERGRDCHIVLPYWTARDTWEIPDEDPREIQPTLMEE